MYQEYGERHCGFGEERKYNQPPDGYAVMQPGIPAARQLALRAALIVAEEAGVDVCALYAPNRGPAEVAFARQMAMYLAHVTCGQQQSGVGEAFGRDRTTVAHACMIIEEHRDDPKFGQRLQSLEMRLLRLTAKAAV